MPGRETFRVLGSLSSGEQIIRTLEALEAVKIESMTTVRFVPCR
jgi:hypothetical protein